MSRCCLDAERDGYLKTAILPISLLAVVGKLELISVNQLAFHLSLLSHSQLSSSSERQHCSFIMHFFSPAAVCASLLAFAGTSTAENCKLPNPPTPVPRLTRPAPEVNLKFQRDLKLDMNHLQKRNCSNNGCTCGPNTPQGTYCGFCSAVTNSGSGYYRDVYECNGSGGCCSYGTSSKCSGKNWKD